MERRSLRRRDQKGNPPPPPLPGLKTTSTSKASKQHCRRRLLETRERLSFGRANITAPTPGLRKTRTAKIVKCPEKASKVLETPQGSRFCSKIRRFRPGISNAWHAFEICAPGIAGRGPATLFFARPGAAHLADFAPGDTRGGPQCRGNARKRPPKPPIWRKKCYDPQIPRGFLSGRCQPR